MTEQIFSEVARKIGQNKKQIETALKVKFTIKSGIITIEGAVENELICKEVIEAINLGFSVDQALDLKQENFIFEKILIKEHTKRNDLSQIRGRLIGRDRKVARNIESLTGVELVIHNNTVGIIGQREDVQLAARAIKRIIIGSEMSNVYRMLEEERAKERAGF